MRAYSVPVCLEGSLLNVQAGFWMSDKPLVQQALASELAELVLTITSTTASVAFLGGFWRTITREWSGIDQLRCVVYLDLHMSF